MRNKLLYNFIPLIILLTGFIFFYVVKYILRHQTYNLLIGVLPNFIVGLIYPYSILVNPKNIKKNNAQLFFPLVCVVLLIGLIFEEYYPILSNNKTFDYMDIIASVVGVCLSYAFFKYFLFEKLRYKKLSN